VRLRVSIPAEAAAYPIRCDPSIPHTSDAYAEALVWLRRAGRLLRPACGLSHLVVLPLYAVVDPNRVEWLRCATIDEIAWR